MSGASKIQYVDDTETLSEGCPSGCELYPPPEKVVGGVAAALAKEGVEGFPVEQTYLDLIHAAYEAIKNPSPHHHNELTNTNIYHLRKRFCAVLEEGHGSEAAQIALSSIEEQLKCFAATLHFMRGYDITKPDKWVNKGHSPTFEEQTRFPDRLRKAVERPDLRGKTDPSNPWMDGLPRIFFVNDMGEALTREDDLEFLEKEFIEVARSETGKRHIYLPVTKRPKLMAQLAERVGGLPPNVCPVVTITGPDTLHRVNQLREVKADVRALSRIEPLLERIPPEKLNLKGIDWVILGGASAGKREYAAPFPLEWAEELRDHCAKHGVAFFLKQLGTNPTRGGEEVLLEDGHGGDWDEWDEDLQVREFPQQFHDYRSEEGPAKPGYRRPSEGGLTAREQKDYKRLHGIVKRTAEKAAAAFVDGAAALREIRDRRLYRAKFGTFAKYCRSIQHMSRQYANRLIKAGTIQAELEPFVSEHGLPEPDNEAQFRELGRLPNTQSRVDALSAAVVEATRKNRGKLTAAILAGVVDKQLKASGPPKSRPMAPSRRLKLAEQKIDEFECAHSENPEVAALLSELRAILAGDILASVEVIETEKPNEAA